MAPESQVTPFVLLANQRSGSNMLALALEQHPQCRCFGELMRGNVPKWRSPNVSPKFRNQPINYLYKMLEVHSDHQAVGFKLMYAHASASRVRKHLIHDPNWCKVLLQRENRLAQYASRLNAKRTRKGVDLQGGNAATVHFKSSEFEGHWKTVDGRESPILNDLEEAQGTVIRLEYASLTQQSLRYLMQFLGLDPITVEVPTHKRMGASVINRFDNPDEVWRYLVGIGKTEWAWESAEEL